MGTCPGISDWPASLLHWCFVEACHTVKKAVSCFEADCFVASLPSFCNDRHLQYANFMSKVKNTNETTDMLCWCVVTRSTSERSQLYTWAQRTFNSPCKNLAWWAVNRGPQTTRNLGVIACPRQYGNITCTFLHYLSNTQRDIILLVRYLSFPVSWRVLYHVQ